MDNDLFFYLIKQKEKDHDNKCKQHLRKADSESI